MADTGKLPKDIIIKFQQARECDHISRKKNKAIFETKQLKDNRRAGILQTETFFILFDINQKLSPDLNLPIKNSEEITVSTSMTYLVYDL